MNIGTICLRAGSFLPAGYLACDGSTYSASDYPMLYHLIRNTYGGDYPNSFSVPDFRDLESRMDIGTNFRHIINVYGYFPSICTAENCGEIGGCWDFYIGQGIILPFSVEGFYPCDGSSILKSINMPFYSIVGDNFSQDPSPESDSFCLPDTSAYDTAMCSVPNGVQNCICAHGIYPSVDSSDPNMDSFVGQVTLFAGTTPPKGWAFCDGRALSSDIPSALCSVLACAYGGDYWANFYLPDTRDWEENIASNSQGDVNLRYIICTDGSVPRRWDYLPSPI